MTKIRTWKEQQAHEREAQVNSRTAWLKSVFANGRNLTECARAANVERSTLFQISKELGIECPKHDVSIKYRRCAEAGMTRSQAARYLGVTLGSIKWAANKFGLKFKPGKPGVPKGVRPVKGTRTIPKTPSVPAVIAGKTMADYAREENARMKRVAAE